MSAISKKLIPMTQIKVLSRQRGFILLPVVLAITLIAGIAYLMNYEGAMNVNSLGKEIESGQAQFVAKAGMNQMLWQANKSNCTGYTNMTNAAFGANSYSATITPTSGSPVSISVTGTHANGASYSIQRDRVKIYQTPVTRVLQPDANAGKDTTIYGFKPTLNYGGVGSLSVSQWGGKTFQSLLEFDVSSLLKRAKIISAKLELYQTYVSVSAGPVGVHRILSPWVEGSQSPGAVGPGATWNLRDTGLSWTTQGGDYVANAAAIISPQNGIAWYTWDITPLVNDWVSGTYTNNGMMLVPEAANSEAYFASSESANPLYFPKLTLNYACECGQSCANLPVTLTLNPVADVDIYAGTPGTNYGTDTLIYVGKDTAGKDDKALIRFDVSSIPVGATVTSATLRLNLTSSSGSGSYDIGIYKIIASWGETTATWSNFSSGGNYNSTQLAVTNVLLGSTGFKEWTLPVGLINEWRVGGPGPNYGLALVYESTKKGPDYQFASKENATVTARPQLVITYTAP